MTLKNIGFGLILCSLCASCFTRSPVGPKPLIVGTSANYPPMLSQNKGQIVGAEADLLQMLAAKLNRPLQFVVLSEEERVGALMTGEVSLLAGGLTLEAAQRWRVGCTDPFLQSGQMAVCRPEDRAMFLSLKRLKKGGISIAVRRGGLSENTLPNVFPRCELVRYPDVESAVADLLAGKRVSLYVDDAPIIWNLVAMRQNKLVMLPATLSTDLYVWGVHPEDRVLRGQIDETLAVWRADGTLRAILKKWLPIAGK